VTVLHLTVAFGLGVLTGVGAIFFSFLLFLKNYVR
jgi:hypothetical protein